MPRRAPASLDVHDERVKLGAGFMKAVGPGLPGFAVLRPLTANPMKLQAVSAWWGLLGPAFHGAGHYFLGWMKTQTAS